MIGLATLPLRWVGPIVIVLLGGGLWYWSSDAEPTPPSHGRIADLMLERMAETIARDVLADSEPPNVAGDVIALAPIGGRVGEALRTRITRHLREQRGVQVVAIEGEASDASAFDSISDWLTSLFAQGEAEASSVLGVEPVDVAEDDRAFSLRVNWRQLANADSTSTLASGHPIETIEKSLWSSDYVQCRVLHLDRSWRFLGWFCLLILPVLGALPLAKRVLARESNLANLALLIGTSVPGLAGAWVLTGFGTGLWGGFLFVLAAGCGWLYGYILLSAVEDAR